MLDDLGRLGGGEQKGRWGGGGAATGDDVRTGVVVAGGERLVDAGEQLGGLPGVGADNDAVGVKEVGDGCTLAQKLWVGDHVEEAAGDSVTLKGTAYPLVGVDRDGGFFDDDLVAGERAGDLTGDGFDVGEVGVAVLGLGRADGDEDGVGGAGGLVKICRKADPCVAVAFQEFREVMLMDEGVSGLEGGDFALIDIDADDGLADLGEADGRNQADVTRPHHGDLNRLAQSVWHTRMMQCVACSLQPSMRRLYLITGIKGNPSVNGMTYICFDDHTPM